MTLQTILKLILILLRLPSTTSPFIITFVDRVTNVTAVLYQSTYIIPGKAYMQPTPYAHDVSHSNGAQLNIKVQTSNRFNAATIVVVGRVRLNIHDVCVLLQTLGLFLLLLLKLQPSSRVR